MKNPENVPANIDWLSVRDDDELRGVLINILREVRVDTLSDLSKEDVIREIKKKFEERGWKYSVAVSVSDPNAMGQRMVSCMTGSPKSGETISFG